MLVIDCRTSGSDWSVILKLMGYTNGYDKTDGFAEWLMLKLILKTQTGIYVTNLNKSLPKLQTFV
jgi:hypothetical protein